MNLSENMTAGLSRKPSEIVSVVPTSDSQREIFAAIQTGGVEANLAFNESMTIELVGQLDVQLFRQAAEALIDRHDSLRSTFGIYGTQLCVYSHLETEFRFVDASDASVPRDVLQQERTRAVQRPFDLIEGPLIRFAVVKLEESRYAALVTAHHIVCDGWSMAILLEDLGALYSAFVAGGAPVLPLAPFYVEYLQHMRSADYLKLAAEDFDYWWGKFSDARPELDLPLDAPRPHMRTFESRRSDRLLDKTLVTDLKRLAAANKSSFVSTLFAVFGVLLHKLSGQNDFVVGMPAAGQAIDQRERLVGHCVNTLPVRVKIDPAESFSNNLLAFRDALFDSYDHQRLTFGQLVQQPNFKRDRSRIPLVSVLYNIDQGIQNFHFAGLTAEAYSNPRESESFELFLNAVEKNGEVLLECQFNTDLFHSNSVEHWLKMFEELLRQVIADPAKRIDEIAMRVADDTHVIERINMTSAPLPPQPLVHALFEEQVQRSPESIASRYRNIRLTYTELEARANRVAHWLDAQGVEAGTLIGVALAPSEWLQPVLLGVLKHGSTYVPIDPHFPIERIRYMIDHSGLAQLICDEMLDERIAANTSAGVTQIADLRAALADMPATALHRPVDPDRAAYVIYTSGSTGQPKGVMVKHRGVANYLLAMRERPGFAAGDSILAITTLSFDIAVTELFLPLICGGSSLLVDRDVAIDGDLLRDVVEANDINVIQATPSSWRLLLGADWAGDRNCKALCGGEALPADLIEQLLPKVGELWNVYGPTETTVWSTCHRVESVADVGVIGTPLANTTCYILDDQGQLAPLGVIGELCIGGDGVAAGYLNRPDLTAERFMANPFGAGRLYRTGDLARLRTEGVIEYAGRSDHQVKVRGYRIELGEIESALAQHPVVAQAVAIAREFQPGDFRLVAYIVPKKHQTVATAELRTFLHDFLPSYMLPQHIVTLDALPMTPNLKIDRKALPAPTLEEDVNARAPSTASEQLLAEIWREVLHVENIALEENFFDSGGHSLTAVDAIRRIYHRTGHRFEVREFIMETLEQLAAKLDRPASGADTAQPTAVDESVRGESGLGKLMRRFTGKRS